MRRSALLALFAFAVHLSMPLLALAATQAAPTIEICTAHGSKTISVDADHAPVPVHASAVGCDFCACHGMAVATPKWPQASVEPRVKEGARGYECTFTPASPATASRPRAPPVFS